jgi:hypothetical protein
MTDWLTTQFNDHAYLPNQKYAFTGTINWMRALSIQIVNTDFGKEKIKEKYSRIARDPSNISKELMVYENLMMAYHYHAALVRNIELQSLPYDTCRSAIISWYYSVYFTGSAMIAASNGSQQETHAATAKVWKNNLVDMDLILTPFSYSLNSLVKKKVDQEITDYRGSNISKLSAIPYTNEQAKGALFSYLKGTAKYFREKKELEIKKSQQFKALGVSNFRTESAKLLRDIQLDNNTVSFLHQAFRYRGKINYRDSMLLTYGEDNTADIVQLIEDLKIVSEAFQQMAAGYIKAKVNKESWRLFSTDLSNNTRLSISPDYFLDI